MAAERYVRVVSLYIHEGQAEAFEAFERDAAKVMAKFGGRIDKAIRLRLPESGRGEDSPFEVHVVSFPDKAAYERYAASKETQRLASQRARIISRTDALEGREAGPYLPKPSAEPVSLDR